MLACQWPACTVALERKSGSGRNPKWCEAHRREVKRVQQMDSRSQICVEDGCDRPVRARGVCNMHYKRELRREGKLASPWDERRRANWQARRALKLGAAVEPFTLADVIARDGVCCGICGVDVDLTLRHPNPYSKSLDHVVPLSRGGAHSADNCQLAHLRCNVSKGARVA